MKNLKWVPVNVPDLAMEIALLESEGDALNFLRGMLLGLTGRGDAQSSRGSQYGLRMYSSACDWKARAEQLRKAEQ